VKRRHGTTLWDSDVPGFGIRLFESGRRSFFFNYRHDGAERRVTIGKFGPVWTVEAARERAKALRKTVDLGGCPAIERRERRDMVRLAGEIGLSPSGRAYLEAVPPVEIDAITQKYFQRDGRD
jgi:hypothetical protein